MTIAYSAERLMHFALLDQSHSVKRKEETLKEQAMTVADERRTISVAVTRKKKMALDAIRNVA
jgi:hypothetical protein